MAFMAPPEGGPSPRTGRENFSGGGPPHCDQTSGPEGWSADRESEQRLSDDFTPRDSREDADDERGGGLITDCHRNRSCRVIGQLLDHSAHLTERESYQKLAQIHDEIPRVKDEIVLDAQCCRVNNVPP